MALKRPRIRTAALSASFLILAGSAFADYPKNWGGGGEGYELTRDTAVKHGGKASGSIKSTDDAKNFASLTQAFRAGKFKGKRVRMSAWVKTEGVEDWSGLWMRVDGKEKSGLAFDNMQDRPIKGTNDWQKFEVVLDVPEDAEEITFGYLLSGKGRGWVDDLTVEVVGKDVAATAKESDRMDRTHDLIAGLPETPKNLDFEQ